MSGEFSALAALVNRGEAIVILTFAGEERISDRHGFSSTPFCQTFQTPSKVTVEHEETCAYFQTCSSPSSTASMSSSVQPIMNMFFLFLLMNHDSCLLLSFTWDIFCIIHLSGTIVNCFATSAFVEEVNANGRLLVGR